jgi:hypothetical protein
MAGPLDIFSGKFLTMRNSFLLMLLVGIFFSLKSQPLANNIAQQDCAALKIVLKIDTRDWRWEVTFQNDSKEHYVKIYPPDPDAWFSFFTLYDSNFHAITSRCVSRDPSITIQSKKTRKNGKEDSISYFTRVDSQKVFKAQFHEALNIYFCKVNKKDFIQFSYLSPLLIYDAGTNKLLDKTQIHFVTKKYPADSTTIISDSIRVFYAKK